ncbi:DNA primase [soil metagenome]
MIPDEVVEEVRQRADIVEVVGEVVALKRSGKDFKGSCPFHDDRSPSFYVVPDKRMYHCFGCGAQGDVFRFLMERQGLGFLDAVRELGGRFGVEVRETTRGDEQDDPYRAHYEANAFAREHFRRSLADPEAGARARKYLEDRGIDEATQERFGLGYAPDDWRGLREAAAKHGITDELLLEVGLLTTSERATEPYDRFRDRIIFPIESETGRVVAFGGRVLGAAGKGVPKYLNSPETPIYHKGSVLYALGWNRNAIRKEGAALVTEGYMDVVSLAAAGVDHAVATLGTALTPDQARLIRRYTDHVLLLFDSDEAGLRATFRGADVLLAAGVQPLVITLPDGEDPDTVVRAEGAAGLRRHLESAVDVVDRKLQLLAERGFFRSIDRTRMAVDKLIPTLRATIDSTLRDIYVSKVAEKTGVRRETLEAEIRQPGPGGMTSPVGTGYGGRSSAPGRPGRVDQGPARPGPDRGGGGRRRSPPALGAERQLLLVLLRTRDWVERAAERIGPVEFRDPVDRAIFEVLLEDPDFSQPPPGLPPEVLRRIEELQGDPEELEHTQRVFDEAITRLRDRSFDARRDALMRELEATSDPENQARVAREMQRLRQERPGRWNVVRRGSPAAPSQEQERTDG